MTSPKDKLYSLIKEYYIFSQSDIEFKEDFKKIKNLPSVVEKYLRANEKDEIKKMYIVNSIKFIHNVCKEPETIIKVLLMNTNRSTEFLDFVTNLIEEYKSYIQKRK